LGNDSIIKTIGLGSIRILINVDGILKTYELHNIYYISKIETNNLLSVSYMVKRSYSVNFRVDKCPIAKNGVIVREAYSIKRLWILEENTLYPDQNSAYIAKTLLSI